MSKQRGLPVQRKMRHDYHFVDNLSTGPEPGVGRMIPLELLTPNPDGVKSTLPNGKLPDRGDFGRYAGNDAKRMALWRQAISESDRMAEAFLEFARRPDPSKVLPL